MQDEAQLKLFHYEADSWQDRTSSLDTAANVICASVTSLSPFAVFEYIVPATPTNTPEPTLEPTVIPTLTPVPGPLSVTIDIKPGKSPNSINLGSNGTVPVAILSAPGFDATTINPLSVTLASAPVQLRGKGTPMVSHSDVNGDGMTDLLINVQHGGIAAQHDGHRSRSRRNHHGRISKFAAWTQSASFLKTNRSIKGRTEKIVRPFM